MHRKCVLIQSPLRQFDRMGTHERASTADQIPESALERALTDDTRTELA